MKKYLSFLIMALVAVLSLTFAACSNDNDEVGPAHTIVGKWKVDAIEKSYNFKYETALQERYTFMFGDDGWYAFIEDVGTWSQEGNMITLISNDPDGVPATFQIVKLTDTYLEMKFSPDESSYMTIKMYRI